jgi:hypothetical protein
MHLLCSVMFVMVILISGWAIRASILKALDDPRWEDY